MPRLSVCGIVLRAPAIIMKHPSTVATQLRSPHCSSLPPNPLFHHSPTTIRRCPVHPPRALPPGILQRPTLPLQASLVESDSSSSLSPPPCSSGCAAKAAVIHTLNPFPWFVLKDAVESQGPGCQVRTLWRKSRTS